MQYGQIPGVTKPVARLIQGTVMIGSDKLDYSFGLLDDIFALGGNAFDAAHVYGNGDNERTLGRWIETRHLRDQVVVITKGAHHNQDRRRVTPFDITADLHDSLARLRTDYIDLYLLHRDDPTVPVGPIVEVLNEHLAAGRIHAFGGSNWSHQRIEAGNAYAAQHGLQPFAVSSPNFSLAIQVKEPWDNCVSLTGDANAAARTFYTQHDIPLLTWSSLAGGFFSGRFRPDNLDTFTAYLDRLCVQSYCYPENFARLERARQLAEQRGAPLAQIAMAYVLAQPFAAFPLVGCANGAEYAANAAALDVALTPAKVAWLESGA
ncbi:aldo/keto reductase [Caldilinea sp.]|uniref:aldo/keto reductase n=1 Tax=Caldilinea sp. TaxID=2293560 RepID=UPI002C5405C9|nr:aldo/keto reductase [Anaerolineales bacterium]HQY93715.1 aldo/keto reductase [Caldilinea sp.]HRA67033.1 aldo/keto reductase [Caldilinea sp.]